EFKVLIKFAGCFIDRMDQDSPDSDDISCRFNPFERIEEESLTQTLSLLVYIHGQATEEDDAHRVISEPFCNALRALVLVHGAGGQSIVTANAVLTNGYVGFR